MHLMCMAVFGIKNVAHNDNHPCRARPSSRTAKSLEQEPMFSCRMRQEDMGFLLRICWSIESKPYRSNKSVASLLVNALLLRVDDLAKAKYRGKQSFSRRAWTEAAK